MVQVSFPGVYVQEVPSGARTITGVSTAIAAFVGMTRSGPLKAPTTVLGFNEFARVFGTDTSTGELTDQVRQFFLNGGQQAIIVRIASGADVAKSTLSNGGAGPNLVEIRLEARSGGDDANNLRAQVDYDTGSPERSFNLTIYQELIDGSGNVTRGLSETFSNLSLVPTDPRSVKRIVESSSAFIGKVTVRVNGVDDAALPSAAGAFSASARLSSGNTAGNDFATLAGLVVFNAGGTGRFKLRVGSRSAVDVVLTVTGPTDTITETEMQSAVTAALIPVGLNTTATLDVVVNYVTTGGANRQFMRISAASAGTAAQDDILLDVASQNSIAADLGLGLAQGGIEVGGRAGERPVPSGLVAEIGNNTLATLMAVAEALKSTFGAVSMTGPGAFSLSSPVVFPLNTPTQSLAEGTAAPNQLSLVNVRQNLQAIADAINSGTNKWSAELQGYRLALTPLFGNSQSGTGNTPGGGLATVLSGSTPRVAAQLFAGGLNGSPPTQVNYQEAYGVIDQQVDLFNLLILPKVGENDRSALWGDASAFCDRRRAFLLIDAEANVDTISKALDEVKTKRIGIVKDHAAMYWPRLKINPDGAPRVVDPSGTIAGIMSRIDSNRGVWKAPAGLEADLRAVLGVSTPMSDPDNGRLNPQALNAIRVFPNGIVSWGARTMDGFDNSGDDDFKYIPVRRFELFIEESLVRGLKFAVFEPNDEPLWAQIRLAVGAFMNNLFRRGAFQGKTTREAYFVKVDSETTTQNDINLGIVNVVVGFAPLKPAEFVVITIQQKAGQVQV